MESAHSILKRYWHHTSFRPLQEEIIQSVLDKKDTLALLPTGGGKSICFQVPAMLSEGICIVVTPLIALMKDQIEQLQKREIQAVAVYSGMTWKEIDMYLDNCVHGNVKFLYVSPERLKTEVFIERFKRMNVSLIAVDEAHCISQWGYDFRPAYLEIAALRTINPDVPIIALTATATPRVVIDIQEKLAFRASANHFQKSFARENLSFVVRKTENKEKKLLEVLHAVNGSSIVYVRSRKLAQELATGLLKKKVSAGYYHAGLSFKQRSETQDHWLKGKFRVMIATNAFGMGIDKADVRLVVHFDLPENIESYYQEAGRAGRDGKRAFATIIYEEADLEVLQSRVLQSHPKIDFLKRVYQGLANYYQLAEGAGMGESFDFEVHDFSDRFSFHPAEVYPALARLQEEGLLQFNDSYYNPSHLHWRVTKAKLYEFQIANVEFEPLVKTLLRLYGGELFSGFATISETYLANALSTTAKVIIKMLKHLDELKIINYTPAKDQAQLIFLMERFDAASLPLDRARLEERRSLAMSKMEAVRDYTTQTTQCRMQKIQDYFGEETELSCGICDICIENRKQEQIKIVNEIRAEVLHLLSEESMTVDKLEERIAPRQHELFVEIIRSLVDESKIAYDEFWVLHLKN